MADIALIGDRDSALLAKAAGMDAFGVMNDTDEAEASRQVITLARAGVKVIFMTERVYALCSEIVEKYKTAAFPAIIPIPDSHGSTGLAMAVIKANVEKAIGVDILFTENE